MSMQRHTTTTTTTAQPAGRVWIATVLLCLALYSVVEGSVNKPEEQDFLTALRLLHQHGGGGGESLSYPASVQERLLHAARPVPQSVVDRNLANNNNDDYYANNNNYYNDDAAQADDDYYTDDDAAAAAGDDYHNDDDYTVTYSNSNQDLTSSALKYVACKNIHSFSTDEGGLQMHRFVVLRLCPATSCSSYNVVGCSSDYLEYMLPVADYLQIMNDYHFTAFEKYCTTCEACTTFEVETDDAAAANNDDYAYSNDDDDAAAANNYYYDDNYNQRRALQTKTGDRSLYNYGYYSNGGGNYGNYGYYNNNNGGGYYNVDDENDDYYNDDKYSASSSQAYPWYIGSSGECIYETVCSNYEAVCQDNTFEPNDETYFTCTAHENGGYAAPHCATDGLTIEIGRYSDYTCSTYTGETVASLQSTYYDQSCVSCNGPESFALVTDDEIDTTSSTYPLCSALYDQSAKCTQHASSSNTAVADYEDESSNQAANEDAVCAYIEALVENNFNEYGEINFQRDFEYSNWRKIGEYSNLTRKASAGQLVMLFLTMSVAGGLAAYAVYLHKKLYFRKPWTPPARFSIHGDDDDTKSEAGRLSRLHSGIASFRSRSSESVGGAASRPYVAYSGSIPHRRGESAGDIGGGGGSSLLGAFRASNGTAANKQAQSSNLTVNSAPAPRGNMA